MTPKTFSVAGTSNLNGTVKVRFANTLERVKVLDRNGHTDINLIELGSELSKADACRVLLAHDAFQGEAEQAAVAAYVTKNVKEIAAELGLVEETTAPATDATNEDAAEAPAEDDGIEQFEPAF